MKIFVSVKKIKNTYKSVENIPFHLEETPSTVEELIRQCVKTFLRLYREKKTDIPLSDDKFEGMKETGKFIFNIHYGSSDVSEEKAVQTAIEAYSDGIVRIFKDETELGELKNRIEVNEGDSFTFIKLTLLSGRMW